MINVNQHATLKLKRKGNTESNEGNDIDYAMHQVACSTIKIMHL